MSEKSHIYISDIFVANIMDINNLNNILCVTIRYDTIEEFNVDSKAEYTA